MGTAVSAVVSILSAGEASYLLMGAGNVKKRN